MMRLRKWAWCGAAMMVVSACGGSEAPPQQADAPAPAATRESTTAVEKPFVSSGKIEMQLAGGSYIIRPAAGDAIRVALGGNRGETKVDVTTTDTQANVTVKDTPRSNFQATIEVPKTADLVIRLAAGDLTVEAITGNKDVESNAGNVAIVTGDANDYARVDASVQAGDLKAGPFGESQSGLFRSLTWSGKGKYALRAKLIAGDLTLRAK